MGFLSPKMYLGIEEEELVEEEEEEEEEFIQKSYTREARMTRCDQHTGGGEQFNPSQEVSPTRSRVAPTQSSPLNSC